MLGISSQQSPMKTHRADGLLGLFPVGVLQDAPDLGFTGTAHHLGDGHLQRSRIREPGRCLAFVERAVIGELNLEAAYPCRGTKQLTSEARSGIPGRFTARRRVEREDQSSAARADAGKERIKRRRAC
jgi:hypothetical protein